MNLKRNNPKPNIDSKQDIPENSRLMVFIGMALALISLGFLIFVISEKLITAR